MKNLSLAALACCFLILHTTAHPATKLFSKKKKPKGYTALINEEIYGRLDDEASTLAPDTSAFTYLNNDLLLILTPYIDLKSLTHLLACDKRRRLIYAQRFIARLLQEERYACLDLMDLTPSQNLTDRVLIMAAQEGHANDVKVLLSNNQIFKDKICDKEVVIKALSQAMAFQHYYVVKVLLESKLVKTFITYKDLTRLKGTYFDCKKDSKLTKEGVYIKGLLEDALKSIC